MIQLENITVKFNDFEALHNISLEVKDGEFFTFLGPSGCGKSTTLRTITGFIPLCNGRIIVNGNDITNVPIEQRNIGIVFQSYALFPSMTVYENIAFGLEIRKLPKDEIKSKVLEIVKKVDLSEMHLSRAVTELSGGQQQRVAIARALVTSPSIICMDEPLSNLDAKLRIGLRNELKRMQREIGITTIYVTHEQDEALTISDRIAVFNKGNIEQIGTPNEIYNKSKTEFVCNFVGDINKLNDNLKDLMQLDKTKQHYVRLERIQVNPANKDNLAILRGKVKSSEYYGFYIKYYIETPQQTIKVIEKNDGINLYTNGSDVVIGIAKEDIMSY